MFSVTDPVADRALLTLAEIKAAVGETGSGNDSELTALGLQISDLISTACKVPFDGVNPTTLLSEEITETIRLEDLNFRAPYDFDPPKERTYDLYLSRYPVTDVASVTVGGAALVAADYEVDARMGVLRYLNDEGDLASWPRKKTIVVYTAGYDLTLLTTVKLAAQQLIRDVWASKDREFGLRSEMHEGLGTFQYFQSTMGSSSGLPKTILDMLAPYVYQRA